MESVRDLQKKYCSWAMATAVVVAFILILAGFKAAGKGLVLGTLFSIINFVIMAETSAVRIGKTPKKTFVISLCFICFRYLLLALPLVLALKFKQLDLIPVIVGLFMIQLVILSDHLRRFMPQRREKQI